MAKFFLTPGGPAQNVTCGTETSGARVTNPGPSTLYYADQPFSTIPEADGTLTAGSTLRLFGSMYFLLPASATSIELDVTAVTAAQTRYFTASSSTVVDVAGTGTVFTPSVPLAADIATLSFTGVTTGRRWFLELPQDGTAGRRIITWSGITWIPYGPPPLTSSSNGRDLVEFFSPDGTTIYGFPLTPSVLPPNLGLFADASRVENYPRVYAGAATASLVSAFTQFDHFSLDRDFVASNILTYQKGTLAATVTTAKVGLYVVSGASQNNYTCIARSANNASRWTANGLDTAPIVDDGAASPNSITSVALRAGVTYAIAKLIVATTAPQLGGIASHTSLTALTPRIASASGGSQTDLNPSYTGLSVASAAFWSGVT